MSQVTVAGESPAEVLGVIPWAGQGMGHPGINRVLK